MAYFKSNTQNNIAVKSVYPWIKLSVIIPNKLLKTKFSHPQNTVLFVPDVYGFNEEEVVYAFGCGFSP